MSKLIRTSAVTAAAELSRNEKQPSVHKQSRYMKRVHFLTFVQHMQLGKKVDSFACNKKSLFETNCRNE